MSSNPERSALRHVGRRSILAAAAAVLAVAGAFAIVLGAFGAAGPPQPSSSDRGGAVIGAPRSEPNPSELSPSGPAPAPTGAPVTPAADLGPVLPAAAPVALDIPSIEVHSTTLMPLSVGADGVLPPPSDYALPGWYTGGPNPGQLGPAIIAGHVDGPDGPAVFYRLGELAAGAQVSVTRDDGTVATFTIDTVERYAKAEFPTARVYGGTNRAEIRLITCGGAFDRTTRHYVDNVIAFGHLNA